jgi:dihydrofolate reductase
MKLTTTAQISVYGVMQGPGGPEEDGRCRFERGGWTHFDDEASTVMDQIYQRAEVFLFGRRTYDVFAGSWGTWADPGDSAIWTALNTKRKYVASTTLSDPRWANTTVLSGDFTAAVSELKAGPGRRTAAARQRRPVPVAATERPCRRDLFKSLFTFPVVVGQGTRLFADKGPNIPLELVASQATPSGVTIHIYHPSGRPRYAA